MSTVEIRFNVDGSPTPWEVEAVRYPMQGQTPTAVRRVTELRRQFPSAAISTERRGVEVRPPMPQQFRFRIFVKDGAMRVNDNQIWATLHNDTLFSRPFTESGRDSIRAQEMEMFPKAELTEEAV